MVLEVSSPKAQTSAGLRSFPEALGEDLFPCLFWQLEALEVLGSWPHILLASVLLSLF